MTSSNEISGMGGTTVQQRAARTSKRVAERRRRLADLLVQLGVTVPLKYGELDALLKRIGADYPCRLNVLSKDLHRIGMLEPTFIPRPSNDETARRRQLVKDLSDQYDRLPHGRVDWIVSGLADIGIDTRHHQVAHDLTVMGLRASRDGKAGA